MDREPQPISLQIGTEDEWDVTLQPEDGQTLAPYDPGDTLACVVGQGPGLPSLFAPSVTWIDAPTGRILLAITPNLTTTTEAGVYPIDLFVTRVADAKRRGVWFGWLELTPGVASSGTAGLVYCTAQHMTDLAGDWLLNLRQKYTQANYLKARTRARSWLDRVILAHVPPTMGQRGDLLYGLNLFGPAESYSRQIKAWLDAGDLIVTDATIEIVSRKAIGYVCEDQIGSEDPDPWPARASRFHRGANNLVRGYIAEIDVNADGIPDYAFNCGQFKLRRD